MLWSTLLSTSNIYGIKNLDNKKSSTKQKVKNEDQQLESTLERWKKMSLYDVEKEYRSLSFSEQMRLGGIYARRRYVSSFKERFLVDFSPTLHPIIDSWVLWECLALYSWADKKGKLYKLSYFSLSGQLDRYMNKKSTEKQKVDKLKKTLKTLASYSGYLNLKETFKKAEKEFQNHDLQEYKQKYKNGGKYFVSRPLKLGNEYVGYVSDAVKNRGYEHLVTDEIVNGLIENYNFYVCFFSEGYTTGLEFVYCLKDKEKDLFTKTLQVKDYKSMNDFDKEFYLANHKYNQYGKLE